MCPTEFSIAAASETWVYLHIKIFIHSWSDYFRLKIFFQDVWISFTFEDRVRVEWRLYSTFKLEETILHEIQSNADYFAWYISKMMYKLLVKFKSILILHLLSILFLGMEN